LSLATTALPAPPPKLKSTDIIEVRKSLNMSQAYFAAILNVSPKTVQSWEQGIREPGDSSLRLLQVVERNPEVVREFVRDSHTGRRQMGAKIIAKSGGKKG
jgi:putative transcriptional regulator